MEMNDRINTYYPSLTKSEQKVALCVLKHPVDIIYFSVTELADIAGTGETTVMRFCRKIGFKGYQDFRLSLAQSQTYRKTDIAEENFDPDNEHDITRTVYHNMLDILHSSMGLLDHSELGRAIACLDQAGYVQFFGVGASGISTQDAKNRFLRIGRRAEAVADGHIQSMMAVSMSPGDVAIGISVSGSTLDTNDMLRKAKQNGATVIAITNYAKSPITSIADIVLLTAGKEAPTEGGSIGARISQLFVIDLICEGLARKHTNRTKQMKERTARAVIERSY